MNSTPIPSAPARVTFPVFPILGVLFIGLKLTGYIAWPWVAVLAPFWAPVAAALFLLGLVALIAVLLALFGGKR